eukprot:g4204.t1
MPGSSYAFSLTISDACGTATASLPLISINSPPTGGSLTVSPTVGYALETKFRLIARGWIDPDVSGQSASSLTYKFVFLEDPSRPGDSSNKRVLIKSQIDVTTYETRLPRGYGKDGILKIGVTVEDKDGASVESVFRTIYVRQRSLPQTSLAQEEHFQNLVQKNVAGATARKQPQEVFALGNMIGDALFKNDIVNDAVRKRTSENLVDLAHGSSANLDLQESSSLDIQSQFIRTIGTATEVEKNSDSNEDRRLESVEGSLLVDSKSAEILLNMTAALCQAMEESSSTASSTSIDNLAQVLSSFLGEKDLKDEGTFKDSMAADMLRMVEKWYLIQFEFW